MALNHGPCERRGDRSFIAISGKLESHASTLQNRRSVGGSDEGIPARGGRRRDYRATDALNLRSRKAALRVVQKVCASMHTAATLRHVQGLRVRHRIHRPARRPWTCAPPAGRTCPGQRGFSSPRGVGSRSVPIAVSRDTRHAFARDARGDVPSDRAPRSLPPASSRAEHVTRRARRLHHLHPQHALVPEDQHEPRLG